MKEIFQDRLNLRIIRTDSPEALAYNLRSATSVFVNEELVPLEVATSATAMEQFLAGKR